MDRDEQAYIETLMDRSASEADHINSIECLEVLLSLDALPFLAKVGDDNSRSLAMRQRAKSAMSVIDPAEGK